MKKINEQIFLRAVSLPAEEPLWREIFYDSVRSHFAPLGLGEAELNRLLETQHEAQTLDYRANYPQAANELILCGGEPVGRVISSTEHDDLHLIDIAVLSSFRGQGTGTAVLKYFFGESRRLKMPIRFYVEKGNPARRLYERLGFRVAADVTTHYQMEWKFDPSDIFRRN